MAKLTATAVKALVAKGKPGAHADGGNLYLRVAGPGSAKWTLRYMRSGKAREMGLGACDPEGRDGVTLAQARIRAEEVRAVLRQGLDPLEERKAATEAEKQAKAAAEAATRTFRDVAEMHVSAHEAGWRNEKHRAQWRSTLEAYAYPVMRELPVAAIETDHVLRVLQPIWTEKPETASRVRGRIEAVLSYATARNWRQGENPARWRGHLDHLLPRRSKVATVENHAALPWQQIATFMGALQGISATAARALEFTILTACRSGEVLGAKWSEIDMEAAVWTVPASRMKAGREHRVPLSSAALGVLAQMAPLRPAKGDTYVFPGQVKGKPLSNMAMLMLLRRMNPEVEGEPPRWRDGRSGSAITAHGFRSSFRDWCEEATSTPHAVSEAALAHTIGDKVEAAYRRGDLFQKRAALMQEWADFCGWEPAEVRGVRPREQATA
ncbi:tyrosine-type recombinase/integrase [Belnapia sp. T6]|uniref:Tyrosine-type recombinase/integrase n=1 Tax=Belnapia mucosa TaxID=2804532 RepID=A0ABS1V8A0_9PROT|nr:site-specific integrase [Belnapia mucosa]MBL6457842.1 tyrosine-type recombinase/integrase [Belnapia mucosa]